VSADVYVVSSLKPNERLRDVYKVSLVQVGSYTFLDAGFDETETGQEHRSAHDMGALPDPFQSGGSGLKEILCVWDS